MRNEQVGEDAKLLLFMVWTCSEGGAGELIFFPYAIEECHMPF